MNQPNEREVLLLCDYHHKVAATVRDHIESFDKFSLYRFHRLSMLGDIPASIDLARFDVVIVHYSLVACMDLYLSPASRERIAQFRGLKCIYIQDEYRFVEQSIEAMRNLGINVLFTCVPEEEIEKVYPEAKLPGVRKVNVLTGYVPDALISSEPDFSKLASRPIDVGYRGRSVPAWLGELGQEKWRIGVRFRDESAGYGLKCDISFREEDRLYGNAWTEFLTSCKATLGTESGSSVFDLTGEIQKAVDADLMREPTLDFHTLQQRHFQHLEGRIKLAQISPRCFECAALGTVMILYEGEYSGRLVPWRHYIPLRKDHGNMAEVVAFLHDAEKMSALAQNAYREVALAPQNSYRNFVEFTDRVVDDAFQPAMARSEQSYRAGEVERIAATNLTTLRRRLHRTINLFIYKAIFKVALGWLAPEARTVAQSHLRKIYRTVTGRLA